jgi:DNA-entry nuclease
VTNKPNKGKIKYAKLDKYGRTGRAVGNITYKMVKDSAGWRQDFEPDSDPSGWGKNTKVEIELYNGRVYRGYMWNRSHLIADSLGGRAFRQNLIKGTRMQNVGANDGKGGMAYTERKVVNYLYDHHKVSVYYSAKPIYKDKELVPRSVIIDVKSSDGKINERVIVYNAAKGFKINYKKGTFTSVKKSADEEPEEPDDPDPGITDPTDPSIDPGSGEDSAVDPGKGEDTVVEPGSQTDEQIIVFTTKSGKKYHLSRECSGLANAGEIYEKTETEATAQGLTLCSICAENRE